MNNKDARDNAHLLHEVAVRGWTYAKQAAETAQQLANRLADAERKLNEIVNATPKSRASDPATSKAAVPSSLKLTRGREAVLVTMRELGPMTDEQIYMAYQTRARMGHVPNASPSGVRTRRCELVRMGLVRSVGEVMQNGSSRCVWAVAS